ncbi:UNVERIFIED_CONTAM: hypothetical protein GTU68_015220, partial [Idotea baltica]|nr:hypothetical protein [Idotea baltica]
FSIVDTEKLYTIATERVAALYGKTYPWELKLSQMGHRLEECAKIIIEGLNLPLTVKDYLQKTEYHQIQLFPNSQLMPGAEKLVRHLHSKKIPIAIASGGAKDNFELKTTNHKELFSLFNHSVLASSDPDVKAGPSPDVFLVCAQRFPDKPDPKKCLVFEDAPNGVSAAVAAHMQVVMVPDSRLDRNLTKGACLVLESLEGFKPELFGLPAYDS